VTRAALGIGLAISEALLSAGAVVSVMDLDTKTLDAAAERLQAYGSRGTE